MDKKLFNLKIVTFALFMALLASITQAETQPIYIEKDMGKFANCGFQIGKIILININEICRDNHCCMYDTNEQPNAHRYTYRNIIRHEYRHFYWNFYLNSQQKIYYCNNLNLTYAKECKERYANDFERINETN